MKAFPFVPASTRHSYSTRIILITSFAFLIQLSTCKNLITHQISKSIAHYRIGRTTFLRGDHGQVQNRLQQQQPLHDPDASFYIEDEAVSYDDDYIPPMAEIEDDDLEFNVTAEFARYVGSPCNLTCNSELPHVYCDLTSKTCQCEQYYPVRLGLTKGCAKPKRIGEQCFYRATCTFADQHATCIQVQHNAICDCEAGYHRVAVSRSNKKVFCAEDLLLITTDFPTLLGVATGIAIFTGLICFVLKLFSQARYTRPRHYANANHAPPMLFSSDTGIPLTLHGRPSSRSSQRSVDGSGGNLNFSYSARRQSSGAGRGPLVPASRAGAARTAAILLISCHLQATKGEIKRHRRTLSELIERPSNNGLGSRRPSLASIHSTTSSARSYSARRLEKERNEKEQRQELKILKQKQDLEDTEQCQQISTAPSPSPRTPHSTDDLLPSVEEGKEFFYNEQVSMASVTIDSTLDTTTEPIISHSKVNQTTPPLPTSVITTTMSTGTPTTSTIVTNTLNKKLAPYATRDIFQM